MSDAWVLATEQQMLHNFHLPKELVWDKRNRVWGEKSQLNAVFPQPPFSLIGDFRTSLPARFTHLVAKTINEDSLTGTDGENPLGINGSPSLRLDLGDIPGAIELISAIADMLPNETEQHVFEPLTDETELQRLGLGGLSHEAFRAKRAYTMRQARDLPDGKQDIYPLVHFVVYETVMHFSMGYFVPSEMAQLEYPKYPFYYIAHPGLYLTRSGVLEVVELIKAHFRLMGSK